MIGNEKYAGIFRHGDKIFTNIYPAIISESLFETVKRKAAGNKYGKHKKDVCYLLKSILFCGYCGKRVCSDSGTSKSGIYQISFELDTFKHDEETDRNVYDYPELHGHLQTMKKLVKDYYNSEIVPILFEYEFLK